jgi:putative serine protease PepD
MTTNETPKNGTRRRRLALAGAGATLALAGAAAGAGTYAATTSSPQPKVVTAAAVTTATPAASKALSVGDIYKTAGPGVVEITVDQQSSDGYPFPYGGGESQAQGSGFVYDDKGDIVTNQHVVDGASTIRVTFPSGKSYKATLVGADASTDLAVIRVDAPASELDPLALADSDSVHVGDGVVAIGSPYGLDGSVTSGIVSALHRQISSPDDFPIGDAIQTDAAINHGNSGGVLLDLQGHVIGVTSQIESASGVNDGVGFAIPSNTVGRIADQLIASGKVQHAYLGVVIGPAAGGGAVITRVQAGTPAAAAGLKDGDVVTAVDGNTVDNASDLEAAITSSKPGEKLTLTVRRDGGERQVTATLGTRPSS